MLTHDIKSVLSRENSHCKDLDTSMVDIMEEQEVRMAGAE